MDLRDQIAEVLYETPDQLVAESAFGGIVRSEARRKAAQRTDAVMGVVQAHVWELEEENEKLRRDILHWRTEATDAKRIMDRRGELVKQLKGDLSHATTFVFGDGLESFAEVVREDSWTVRSWERTERHDDQAEALSRAREIAGEEA